MRVCVVGCGAIGSLFAANLATLEDVEVWAFDLNKAHVDAINTNGLQLTGVGNVHSRPQATSDPEDAAGLRFRHRRHQVDAHPPRSKPPRTRSTTARSAR